MSEEPKKHHSHGKSLWGAGWGGPANGPGNGTPKGVRTRDHLSPEEREMQNQLRALRREQILQMFLDVASDANAPAMARITAGDRYLDRTEGKAVQAVVNHDGGEKSLEDLIKESMTSASEPVKH